MISTASKQILQLLDAGNGKTDPILVVDFQAFTPGPRLSQLLIGQTEGRPVYQVDPISVLAQDRLYVPLQELAADCVSAFLAAESAGGHVFVIGHCSAASLSLHVAKLLERCREVTVILVQPTWPDEEHIRIRFASFQANIGAVNRPGPDVDGDPSLLVAQMEQILSEGLIAVAAKQGLDGVADVFSDLLAWYRAWLAFLLACKNDIAEARATEAAAVKVLIDTQGSDVVPGMRPGVCHFTLLPIQANPVTAELAEFVLTELSSHAPERAQPTT